MPRSIRIVFAAALVVVGLPRLSEGQHVSLGKTYYVNCSSAVTSQAGSQTVLRSLEEVNALQLQAHDSLLFLRGTVCRGALQPKGNGFSIDATGTGSLPVIQTGPGDEAALRLFNQENITISSLELRGGTTYGVFVSGDQGIMHSITLRNLTVRDVRGPLKHKESGLIVIKPASPAATFADIHVDGVRAYNTTQWSGIFIAGGSLEHPATAVTIEHSVVHDVQGDGIVIFNARNSTIRRSVAWHTGMQHQQTVGTPNAIWTWQCNQCVVEENEAFLTDSPGVDGGAFDIDWGNTANTVRHNYAHDTQGYCISIFAANGPTRQSTVDGNLCLNNGMGPRLAQRQGAILLMTWNGGSIDGLILTGNRIDWHPAGNAPAIQSGSKVSASNVFLNNNEIKTSSTRLIDPAIHYTGQNNHYLLADPTPNELAAAQKQVDSANESGAVVESAETGTLHLRASRARNWQLEAAVPTHTFGTTPDLAALLINLKTAAVEYGRAGLRVSLAGDAELLQAARDWGLQADGVVLASLPPQAHFSLKLASPTRRPMHSWPDAASPADIGLVLRETFGEPDYSRLEFENVRATD